jgi:hypothetical protein
MLSMLHALEHLLFCCLVAFELICDDYSWNKTLLLEELAETALCRLGK